MEAEKQAKRLDSDPIEKPRVDQLLQYVDKLTTMIVASRLAHYYG